jgi:hypothetical protein
LAQTIASLRKSWADGSVWDERDRRPKQPPAAVSRLTQSRPARTGRAQHEAEEDWFAPLSPLRPPRWRSLSDFLGDAELWGGTTLLDRVRVVYPFSAAVTFHSLSYKIVTENLPDPVGRNEERRAASLRSERIVAGDRGATETVSFRYRGGNRFWETTDTDVQYGVPGDGRSDTASSILAGLKTNRSPVYDGPRIPPREKRDDQPSRSPVGRR